ncbi:MAG: DUF2330 domain-containing protein [Archangium sp.]|nr:DUF2330 domain-containing protein [Archangium sp.]
MRIALLIALASALAAQRAEACGCFTPPNPTVPVVQAGERILFAVKDGQVTAHIQVQFSGGDADFGWLLPLPSVPTLELGNDELFARLLTATQPRYQMSVVRDSSCQFGFATGGGATGGGAASGGGAGGGSQDAGSGPPVLVVESSVGPYDYAVLHADSKTDMLDWLAANRYFVPTGTDDAVTPYIHEGGYFLALKLRPGKSTGDLQPVVLRYQSDFGVIPITLTATGAQENMGVQVWMLGDGRAIPRNYHHTLINDAAIDWVRGGANYNDVIIRAVGEAPGRHTFVTEYSGSGSAVKNLLLPANRFGVQSDFSAAPTPDDFIALLWAKGFQGPTPLNPYGASSLPSTVKAILAAYIPPPQDVNLDTFYANYAFYKATAPAPNYQPQQMAQELWERVVTPSINAAQLFETHSTLTRLYSTISPADMNRDPAFSFNPSLPPVSNLHQATMRITCPTQFSQVGLLTTEQGWNMEYPNGQFGAPLVSLDTLPASLRVEVAHEEGPSDVIIDNLVKQASTQTVSPRLFQAMLEAPTPMTMMRSCSVTGAQLGLAALAVFVLRRRRR